MPPSPKVPNVGISGNKVTFTSQGRTYQTAAISSTAAAALAATITEAQAQELIRLGLATPLQDTYLAQFPWTNPPK